MTRVLGRIRLSRLTEESTSAARQRQLIEQWADMNGHTIVGWAEDVDVSGSIDPFDTPQLGDWLTRPDEWDILCAWKLDRIGRRAIPLNKLFGWILENRKVLVCVSDNIDLSHWVGRLVANVIAGVAEGELEAIRERTKASRKKLLEDGRWPGGTIPYGFTPQPLEGGGWKLAHNPPEVAVIRLIADLLCEGESILAVANQTGLNQQTVKNIATSKTLLGHATYAGTTVRDATGAPVLYADPVLTQQQWDRLQAAVAARSKLQKRTRRVSPMYGVGFCMTCEKQLHQRTYFSKRGKKEYRYYMCPLGHGRSLPADEVDGLVFGTFLNRYGDDPVMERVYRPAEDHQAALEAAMRAVDELSSLAGTIPSGTVRSRLTEQMRALSLEVERLEQLPSRPAGWEHIETGVTFRQTWPNTTTDEKRRMIIDKQVTALLIKHTKIEFMITMQKSPPSDV